MSRWTLMLIHVTCELPQACYMLDWSEGCRSNQHFFPGTLEQQYWENLAGTERPLVLTVLYPASAGGHG